MRLFDKVSQKKVLRAFTLTGLATAIALAAGCSSDNPDDYIRGFPSHPHRGFETVTYLLAGKRER